MRRPFNIQQVRNFGIIAHVDAGKTTLTERVLYLCGAIRSTGEVHDGSTTTDSEELERKKGITINAATVTCKWHDHELHLIDTPGHVDFSADVELSLRVLDGAVVVLDGVAGVEPQTESVWRQADRHQLPRICFVNKLDRDGASLERCLDSMRERLSIEPAVVMLPLVEDHRLVGLVDVVREVAYIWTDDGFAFEEREIPSSLREAALEARRLLIERCSDIDDALAEKFLNEEPISSTELVASLRLGTLAGDLVPVLCGAAYKNRGIQQLLDAICAYLPSPSDRPAAFGIDGQRRAPREEEPLSALTFKVIHDDFGQLSLVRVFSGALSKGDRVHIEGRSHRLGRLVQVFADRRVEIERAMVGDIVGLVGMPLEVGDTLSAPHAPIMFVRPTLPEPVMRLCLEPQSRDDRDRLGEALAKMVKADPSLRIETDAETGRAVLCGLGELHLDVAVEKLRSQHRTKVVVGAPSVAYREAIQKEVRHETKFSKQSGGPGQFALVVMVLSPGEPGGGLVFVDETRGGVIAPEFISGVRAGVVDAMAEGVLSGYPLSDLHVRLVDGSMHSHDSNERAFRAAARLCTLEAARLAEPYLLEPVMNVEVVTPEQLVGKVIGDIGARRGKVTEMAEARAERVIRAAVPLSELFGYVGTLRSLTSGRASFSTELGTYQAVPASIAKKVLKTTAA